MIMSFFFLRHIFFQIEKYPRIDMDPTSIALESVDPRVFDMWNSALPLAREASQPHKPGPRPT